MTEYTISGRKANLYGLLFVIPVLLLYGIPYILIWRTSGSGILDSIISVVTQNYTLLLQALSLKWWLLLILLIGILLHELIHGIFMAIFAKNGWKSVSFGFNLHAFAPYTHCSEPLTPLDYRISLIMPALLLGEIPVLIGWFTGNILFLIYGILFIWVSAGDFTVFLMSRKIKDGMLQDHPDKIGFIHVYEANSANH